MFQLAEPVSFEQIIKKSRFLAFAIPVASEDEAKDAIAASSTGDANHNCWAWRIGQAYRFFDDGEPGGTAGKPILAAIDGQDVDNIAVVVTRWFGGVKLGTGGLMRAYGGTAASCLKAGTLSPVIAMTEGTAAVPFSDLALVKARLLSIPGLSITREDFTATGADITLSVPITDTDTVSVLVSDLTNGRSQFRFDD